MHGVALPEGATANLTNAVLRFRSQVLGAAVGLLEKSEIVVQPVELPPVGDVTRSLNPFGWFYKEQGPMFMHINPDKYYLALDLHIDMAQQIFKELCAKADVVEFNLRPAVTNRWNIGYEDIKKVNPGIIYIEKNGFGQWGPYVERPSYDAIAQSESGMAWITGFPDKLPLKAGIWLADYFGGLMGAVGVLGALAHRDRTGKGQYIEFSQAENLIRVLDWTWIYQHLSGKERERYGNRDVSICPADIFQAKDEIVAIGAATDGQFQGLCGSERTPA